MSTTSSHCKSLPFWNSVLLFVMLWPPRRFANAAELEVQQQVIALAVTTHSFSPEVLFPEVFFSNTILQAI